MINQVLQFNIKADASQATAEIKKADTSVKNLGTTTKTTGDQFSVSEKNFLRVSKSLGVDLSSSTQRSIDKLEGLKNHLIATNAPTSDLERVNNALTAAQSKLGNQISDTTTKMGFWDTHGQAIATTAGVMGGAILAMGIIAVDEFTKSEVVVADLEAAIASTGGAAGITKDKVLALSDELSKITPFDDEVITQAQTLLITFGNIGDTVLPAATEAALNLATRFDTDVTNAARTLGKALSDPERGLTALNRLTGKFTEEEIKAIKEMVNANDKLGAQNAILDKLEIKLGGAARAAGETFAGKLAIARTEVGNLNEEAGSKLVPILEDLMGTFPTVSLAVIGLHDAWGKLGISGGELLIALPLLKTAFGGLGLASIAQGFSAIVLAVTPFAGILAAVTLGLGAFYIAWSKIGQETLVNENLKKSNDLIGELQQKASAGGMGEETFQALALESGKAALKIGETKTQQQLLNEKINDYKAKVKPLTGDIQMWVRETDNIKKASGSHVLTLQQQIDKQRALIAQLGTMTGKDEELTDATDKLQGMLKKQSDETRKATDEQNKLINATGALTPKLKDEIAQLEKGIQLLKDKNAAAGDVERASMALKGKIDELAEAEKTLSDKFIEWQTSGKNQFDLLEDLVEQTNLMRAANIALANTEDPLVSNNDTLIAANQHVKDVIEQWDKFTGKVEETPGKLQPTEDKFNDIGDVWDDQVSTIKTDFGNAMSDIIFEGGEFVTAIGNIGKESARVFIRYFFEDPNSGISKLTKKVQDWGKSIGGILGSVVGAVAGPGVAAGVGLAVSGIKTLFQKFFGGGEKKEDTEIVEKGWPEIWKLHREYQNTEFKDIKTDQMNRIAILEAGISGWNDMARAFKSPGSRDSQRPGIFQFIDAINKEFANRTGTAPSGNLPIQPLAQGGIVTRPTVALIGERGPEAVVPLGQGMGGITIQSMTIVSNDPQKWAEDLKRMVQNNRGDMKRFLKQQLLGTA